MRIEPQRHLFDIPDDVTYLNCAYMSPLLQASVAAGEAGIRRKAQPWTLSAQDFFTESEMARSLYAQLIGATAEQIALIPSVSYGIAIAASNLPLLPDKHVLLLAEEFPADVYPWWAATQDRPDAVVTVPRPADHDFTAALLRAINERTGIVVTPNCHWTDGSYIDLCRVGQRAREVGAALVVDATQSLGAAPLDVAAVQPDFLVVASYKWLLCPYSTGFIYIAPKHHHGKALEQTWLGRGGSENFANLINYRQDYQPGARRFDMGERANFALMPAVIAALRQLLDWGVANIAATLEARTNRIAAQASQLGCEVSPAPLRANHMIGLRFKQPTPPDLAARLAASKVYVSLRGSAIRVSPHLYNTDSDIDRFIAVLREAL